MGGMIAIAVLSALVICFVCAIVKCSKLKVKLRKLSNDLNGLQMTEQTRQEQIRQNEETNREQLQQNGETNREQLQQNGETKREQLQQNEETVRVEMQEIGKTIRAMIEQGMSREEQEEYLSLLKENLNYVRKRATSRMATDGDNEKQSFINFLDEMQIPHSVTNE